MVLDLGLEHSENDPKLGFLNDMNVSLPGKEKEVWDVDGKNPSFVLVCFFFNTPSASKTQLSLFLIGNF